MTESLDIHLIELVGVMGFTAHDIERKHEVILELEDEIDDDFVTADNYWYLYHLV